MREWLANLKVGDKVIVVTDHGCAVFKDAGTVDAVTKKGIRVAGYYYSHRTGQALGLVSGGGMTQAWIVPLI